MRFETDDGAVIYVENRGIRRGPIELIQKLNRGEAVDPALIYFRTMPRFETGAARYRWLMQSLFVASAARHSRPRGDRREPGAVKTLSRNRTLPPPERGRVRVGVNFDELLRSATR